MRTVAKALQDTNSFLKDLSEDTSTSVGWGRESNKEFPSVNYVTMGDSLREERDIWAVDVFDNIQYFEFSQDSIAPISRVRRDFQVLAIGGEDVRRAANYIKDNMDALQATVKIAVLSNSSPEKRAKLLKAGYDAVFDPLRCEPGEARAHITSIVRSYSYKRIEPKNEYVVGEDYKMYVGQFELTNREILIMKFLSRKKGSVVRYSTLQAQLSGWIDEITLNNLKVMVSNLRKKLVPGVSIVAHMNTGYELRY